MGEFNIAPNTQIGRIEIDNTIYQGENAYGITAEKYSRGGEFIENMVTDNFIEFCCRWFNLADIKEMLDDIDEFYMRISGVGNFSNLISAGYGNGISPILPVAKEPQVPITFGPKVPINPIVIDVPRDKSITYNSLSSKELNNE